MTTPTPPAPDPDMEAARKIAPCDCDGIGDGITEPRGHTDECRSHIQPRIAAALKAARAEMQGQCIAWLSQEAIEHDPDDLYTGRAHRVAAIRALKP